MSEDIQKLKNKIWYAKKELQDAQKDVDGWVDQLAVLRDVLEADPDAEAALNMKPEIEAAVAAAEASRDSLQEKLTALEARLPEAPEAPEAAVPKFDPEKHPLLRKTAEKSEPAKPVVFNTGDICEAFWKPGKAFYKAKIQSILGSASAPKYHIRFLDYDDTMTVDRDALRPLPTKHKREPDALPAPAPAPPSAPVTSTPHVISGPASVNPQAQAAKPDALGGPTESKKRKIPNKKQLEKGVTSWKNWSSKGVGKKISQKDSMFRTGTNANSRVGFTGSGGGMTETNKRMRYDNKVVAEVDEDDN